MTGALITRDLRRAVSGALWLPVIFFLIVASLVPFAVGPDAPSLERIGPGMILVAALLAALLPIDRLIAPDLADGTIDQLRLRGLTPEWIALSKMVAHWLSFAPPMLLALLPAAALLGLSDGLDRTALALLLTSPGLAGLALAAAGLTAGLERAGALAGLLVLPIAVPLLIFGVGAANGEAGAFPLLAAVTMLISAGAPFVTGAALRQRG
ncbi:heme exporter protein CcmB [Sphingomicrobium sp. XHP0239]|uniref:heme exporter protein CcmB n=1 Tax=Sphingomicrobium maritimum TaxID=3133972 RepID=UPI0031CC5893